MENTYYAQPYDMDANGFYFHSEDDYKQAARNCRNSYGQTVEEFEIQFIDGDRLNCELFQALSICQSTIHAFIKQSCNWSDGDKIKLILAVGECGYSFDIRCDDPNDLEVDTYKNTNLHGLAHEFVDEGLFGDIPSNLIHYIDYDAIARDLGIDYAETSIAGDHYVYRAA